MVAATRIASSLLPRLGMNVAISLRQPSAWSEMLRLTELNDVAFGILAVAYAITLKVPLLIW